MVRTKPNIEDAQILLELEHLRQAEPSQKANKWFWSEFKPKKIASYSEFREAYPEGSEGDRHAQEIGNLFELCGVLVNNGLLSEALFFDRYFVKPFWEPLKPIVEGQRDEIEEPRLAENFELLYEKEKEWHNTHPPKISRPLGR